jgi:hypothetical protein
MRLPAWSWPLLRFLRHQVAAAQALPMPTRPRHPLASGVPDPLAFVAHTPLRQPSRTSCGSSLIVMLRMLRDTAYAAEMLGSSDPVAAFDAAAAATLRRTNAALDRFGRLQLPWPRSLGTRPAALIRDVGGGLVNRVVDPEHPDRAYDAIVRAGEPLVLFIGEGSWMQHIVLVTRATPEQLTIYDPACGQEVVRTRAAFESATLDVAGWPQPWLVLLPAGAERLG